MEPLPGVATERAPDWIPGRAPSREELERVRESVRAACEHALRERTEPVLHGARERERLLSTEWYG